MKLFRILFPSCLILLSVSLAQGPPESTPKVLSPELLWNLIRVSDVQVSPDGKTVIMGATQYDIEANKGNRNIYSMSLGINPGDPVMITDWDGSEFNARWRPDGEKIGFLSAKSGSVQLWEMNPDGSNKKQVSDIEGGISNFAYSPAGSHISFTRNIKLDETVQDIYPDLPEAEARIINDLMYRHWDRWHDYKYRHLFIMDYQDGVLSGEPLDVMPEEKFDTPLNPFGGSEQIAWASNGKHIAYTCKKKFGKEWAKSTNSDIYLFNIKTRETRNLTAGNPGYDMDPVFSPDGKKMAWLSMAREGFESDKNRLMILDLESGESLNLTENWDYSAGIPVWSEDSKTLYFVAGHEATYQFHSVDLKKKEVKRLTEGWHNYRSIALVDGALLGMRQSMSYPSELYRFDLKKNEQEQLTFFNLDIMESIQTGQVKKELIPTTDGKEMLTWVIYPPDFDPDKKYPALLYCQGGPQSAVSQFFSYRWNFQLMAAKGYIVIAPNRRGLPTFGREWNDQISGDWGGQNMLDYLSATDHMLEKPWIDAGRIGCVGASYGGYSVYNLAGIHEGRFKAFISHCGLYNLESWYGTTEEMFFANWDLGGAYWENPIPKSYLEFSPHDKASNWDTPIMVIHGQRDYRVPVTQGMEAFQAAQLQGIPSKFLYFPDEGHWILGAQNGLLWHREFFSWLDKWLKQDDQSTDSGR